MDWGKLKIKFLSNPTNFKFSVDLYDINYLTTKILSKTLVWKFQTISWQNKEWYSIFALKKKYPALNYLLFRFFKLNNLIMWTLNKLFFVLHFCLLLKVRFFISFWCKSMLSLGVLTVETNWDWDRESP